MNDVTKIYVRLLEEGTTVYRPAAARRVSKNEYEIILDSQYSADDEIWEFPPGSLVVCELRTLDGDEVLVAVNRSRSA